MIYVNKTVLAQQKCTKIKYKVNHKLYLSRKNKVECYVIILLIAFKVNILLKF